MGPLTWDAEAKGKLCCEHSMAVRMENKEAFSGGQQPPPLICNFYCDDSYTCAFVQALCSAHLVLAGQGYTSALLWPTWFAHYDMVIKYCWLMQSLEQRVEEAKMK